MKTIHIKGSAETILENLSNNFDLRVNFPLEEEGEDTIENCFVRFYTSETKCTLEEAINGHLEKMFGKATITGQEYGYSEYTIEGFNINTFKIGKMHDLQKILDSKKGKYVHMLIDQVNFND